MKACVLLLLLATSAFAQSLLPDSEIRRILADRIDAQKQAVGIVAGVIDLNGRRIVSYGALGHNDSRTLNGDTLFEIGSITKVFTSLLLADMALRGEVAPADPVSKYLPEEVTVPVRSGNAISLQNLANHHSGLPRLPGNFHPKDPTNPYADYTVEDLYQFLSNYALPRSPGNVFEYSNVGGGLLGHALARRAGMSYEALVKIRIARPLGMSSTAIELSEDLRRRLATGHNSKLEAVPNWDLPALAGAGALRSTANDMLNFAAAALGYRESPLAEAFASMLRNRRDAGPSAQVGLGWLIATRNGREIVWHNGGTGGYRSFIGFDAKARAGVVVLSNTSTAAGVDDIGMHLLNPASPLLKPPKERKEISVDPTLFDTYAGRYQLAPNFILTITREGDRLFGQATGQPKFQLFAETENDYFLKEVDAQVTFAADGSSLTLHQNGQRTPARRIE